MARGAAQGKRDDRNDDSRGSRARRGGAPRQHARCTRSRSRTDPGTDPCLRRVSDRFTCGRRRASRSDVAVGAGSSTEAPPEQLDAAIIFAPVVALVPAALRATAPGGTGVCAGFHMSDIPSFPYDILWREIRILSVANLTRRDGEEFLERAPRVPVRTSVVPFPLKSANEVLERLRGGRLHGAAVLTST